MTKLEQLKAAHEAASPKATWVYEDALSAVVYVSGDRLKAAADLGKIDDSKSLGEFIALAHNTMPLLLEAVEALEAIKARFDGVFDHPVLVKYGPLDVSMQRDMYRLADNALEKLK